MIHGQKRSKHQEKTPEQIKEQEARSQKINSKLKEFFTLRKQPIKQHQIPALLQFTALLMQLCSDIPTIFNFRREILTQILTKAGAANEQNSKLLIDDYKLNTKIIQSDPKSYTLWTHRQWLIQKIFEIDSTIVQKEKELTKKLLQKDEKNFHVWNYRSWVNTIKPDVEGQLKFTKQKIIENPFNFSPLHFRSLYLTRRYNHNSMEFQEAREDLVLYGMPRSVRNEEIESIQTAIFLNPKEEAPWNFYNWMMNRLVPCFMINVKSLSQTKKELQFSMKVSNPKCLIENENVQVFCQDSGVMSEKWIVQSQTNTGIEVLSTLDAKADDKQWVHLENTGCFVIGMQDKQPQLKRIHKLLEQQLAFVHQVIESQQGKCRLGWIQAIMLRKYLLQSNFYQNRKEACQETIKMFDHVSGQAKNQKYMAKLKEYWTTLQSE